MGLGKMAQDWPEHRMLRELEYLGIKPPCEQPLDDMIALIEEAKEE